MPEGWKNVGIPEEMWKLIDEIVKRPDFISRYGKLQVSTFCQRDISRFIKEVLEELERPRRMVSLDHFIRKEKKDEKEPTEDVISESKVEED